jgi:hypothetical protein
VPAAGRTQRRTCSGEAWRSTIAGAKTIQPRPFVTAPISSLITICASQLYRSADRARQARRGDAERFAWP